MAWKQAVQACLCSRVSIGKYTLGYTASFVPVLHLSLQYNKMEASNCKLACGVALTSASYVIVQDITPE